jgi:hypothetical protein
LRVFFFDIQEFRFVVRRELVTGLEGKRMGKFWREGGKMGAEEGGIVLVAHRGLDIFEDRIKGGEDQRFWVGGEVG